MEKGGLGRIAKLEKRTNQMTELVSVTGVLI
jgi:hypothetical protein